MCCFFHTCVLEKFHRSCSNQTEICLFGKSLDTPLCEIYDHKAAFLLVRTVVHKNFNLHIWKKTYRYYRFK